MKNKCSVSLIRTCQRKWLWGKNILSNWTEFFKTIISTLITGWYNEHAPPLLAGVRVCTIVNRGFWQFKSRHSKNLKTLKTVIFFKLGINVFFIASNYLCIKSLLIFYFGSKNSKWINELWHIHAIWKIK